MGGSSHLREHNPDNPWWGSTSVRLPGGSRLCQIGNTGHHTILTYYLVGVSSLPSFLPFPWCFFLLPLPVLYRLKVRQSSLKRKRERILCFFFFFFFTTCLIISNRFPCCKQPLLGSTPAQTGLALLARCLKPEPWLQVCITWEYQKHRTDRGMLQGPGWHDHGCWQLQTLQCRSTGSRPKRVKGTDNTQRLPGRHQPFSFEKVNLFLFHSGFQLLLN